jgi:hypothetical protein
VSRARIRKRRDGRYEGRLQHKGRRVSVYGWSLREVEAKLSRLAQDLERLGRFPAQTLLRDWAAQWLNELHLRPRTVLRYRQLLETHVLPELGTLRLDQVRPLHVARVVRLVQEWGRSATTSQHVRALA